MLFLHLDTEIKEELKVHLKDPKMQQGKKEVLEAYNELKEYAKLKMRDHRTWAY